jgi:hypothetical protein
MEDLNCYQSASNFNSITNSAEKENHGDWLYTHESTIVTDSIPDSATPDASSFHKRPNMVLSSIIIPMLFFIIVADPFLEL